MPITEIYKTNNGLQATEKELIEMLEKYSINELNEFYYGLFDKPTKAVLKPYFLKRMRAELGL